LGVCGINPFQGLKNGFSFTQGCRWRSNPGLKLANAFGVTNPGLELANAFGVTNPGLKLANAFGVTNPGLAEELVNCVNRTRW
ncbi:MAG TPA: hypothetical protein VM656_04125, partial [Pyrinomonadaceae bacterium]|nr:hypothetical protein [Pyrinomonadaceae bacterium]